jgi:predicted amidophosphoribosyltransferase
MVKRMLIDATHPEETRVVVLDDVTTTGTTLLACTQALQAAGVKQVDAVVLARTPA